MSFKLSEWSDLSKRSRVIFYTVSFALLAASLLFKLGRHGFSSLTGGTAAFHTAAVLICIAAAAAALPFLHKLSAEKNFLIIWTLLSMLFMFSGTLFKAADENGHFYRSFEISKGYAVSEVQESSGQGGRELPLDVDLKLLRDSWGSFSENKDMTLTEDEPFIIFTNLSLYCPVSYLPQSAGILIARLFTKNIAVIAYAGRIANWLAITIMTYFAIKVMPVKKELMLIFALLPMNIYEATSMAPDGLVVALSMLMFAYVLYLRFEQTDTLSVRQYILLYLMAWSISLLKIVYLPICMIYFLIPAERFGSTRNKIIHAVVMALLAVGSNLIWLMICKRFLTIPGTDSSEQLRYVLHDPLNYVKVMIRTALHGAPRWMLMMIGGYLGALNIETSKLLALVYMLLLVTAFIDFPKASAFIKAKKNGTPREKTIRSENVIFGLIVFSILMLIAASIYIEWNAPHSDVIVGVQGRYFIALLLPLYFAFHNATRAYNDTDPCPETRTALSEYIILLVNACAGLDVLFACL
ncbi:Predicted membrane protein [Ruminococcus sp. YE71]|uniref:DUF2142 domain-containing protein n=1 Tax=unclassified Ruminococcus TaxID=2608920 RepID=UPI00088D02C4|nr:MULTISPECIES: DUF2142 domain-containing protein [unclassified Ruminococcus]SDA19807.1 Predicted membrane protein [Ruminococcus sp. YE78]SFW31410.1 Predicted membrane protein [Ruminococcus sp. YE71]